MHPETNKQRQQENMQMSCITIFFHFFAACVVQILMLAQAGVTYLILRRRYRNYQIPPNFIPLNSRLFATNKLVSIIIPAYNEAACIKQTLLSAASRCSDRVNTEMIVVDAGGQDGTMTLVSQIAEDIKTKYGISIRYDVKASGGRGPTLNAGAKVARGNILLFLHADTLLPVGYDEMVRKELRNESILATAFRFKVARPEGCKVIIYSIHFNDLLSMCVSNIKRCFFLFL
jgi:cellulose synthase/poly-beta-1,6-N-acetylglucosamine synthase-like glycosyltransferase